MVRQPSTALLGSARELCVRDCSVSLPRARLKSKNYNMTIEGYTTTQTARIFVQRTRVEVKLYVRH